MSNGYMIFRPRVFVEFSYKGVRYMTAVGEWFKWQGVEPASGLQLFSTNVNQPLSAVGIDCFVCAAHLVPHFCRIRGSGGVKSFAHAERNGATTSTHWILNVFASRDVYRFQTSQYFASRLK